MTDNEIRTTVTFFNARVISLDGLMEARHPTSLSPPGALSGLLRRAAPLLWVLGVIGLLAAVGQVLMAEQEPNELITDIEYLLDPDGSLTVADAIAESDWQTVDGVPNFGFRDEAFWFRLSVPVEAPEPVNQLLELSYPILDSVQLHVFHDAEQTQEFHVGDDLPFSARPIRHRNCVSAAA